jgi:hypothetical protein
MSDGRICSQTALTFRVSQRRRLKLVVQLFFGEFFGREISDAFSRHGIILECQFERPGAVFVVGLLHVGGDGAVRDVHSGDNIKIGTLLRSANE